MAKKIIWTKRANSKFNKIIDYLEQEWGPNVTQNFVRKTYDIIDLISDKPAENIEKEFQRLLNVFISDYKFSLTAKTNFAQCSPTTYMPQK